ncbi:MAG: nuclear transport factor 2 family protein [Oxalobacteraceae bacterium]
MHRFVVAMLCCASIAVATAAQAAGCEPMTADEAIQAEDARYAAQMGNDFAAMDRLIANDLVYIHSSALVDNKQTYIESMRTGAVKYRVMRRSDVVVRTFGCVATLTGNGNFDVTVNDKEMTVELRFHAIWAKRDGKVQFISWQATRLPAK